MASSQTQLVSNYLGVIDRADTEVNDSLFGLLDSKMPPARVFAQKYKVLPCTMSTDPLHSLQVQPMGGLHATSVIQFLVDEYKLDPNTFISTAKYDNNKKHTLYTDMYIDLGDYLLIHLCGGYLSPNNMDNPLDLIPDTSDKRFECFNWIEVFYIPQVIERARTVISQVSCFKVFPVIETSLQMVCYNQHIGFYTSPISIKRPLIKDLRLHYGDGFPELHKKLLSQLTETSSTGITLLHGPPGTGKTFYIRYLINEIKNKSLIYVPPDLVTEMTKPGFLPFLMKHPNSILIVEDAENVIINRKEAVNPNQAVSNLLNLSDGLLGDVMQQQIITTFNCEMKGIDPALLRQGRLVVEHQFDKLSVNDARRLCDEMGIEGSDQIQEPMALADIYAKKSVLKQ